VLVDRFLDRLFGQMEAVAPAHRWAAIRSIHGVRSKDAMKARRKSIKKEESNKEGEGNTVLVQG
jgi:hypothetical protein